jgi:hypothetical protein
LDLALKRRRFMARVVERGLKKRSRTSNADSVVETKLYSYSSTTEQTTLQSTQNITAALDRGTLLGWNIPDFHRRVKRGELLPHTPFRQTFLEGSHSGAYSVKSGTPDIYNTWYYDAGCPWPGSASIPWAPTDNEVALHIPPALDIYVQEAASAIYSQGWDVLTFLAEFADVKRMFVSIAKSLVKPKRRVKMPPWEKLRSMSCKWLALRYGWRPLISDIGNLIEAVKKLNGMIEKRNRYSEKRGSKWSSKSSKSEVQTKTHYELSISTVDLITVSVRGSVVAEIEVPALQLNPAVTAWEIIPFSFVLDWFISVGKSLSAASFMLKQNKYAASVGYSIKFERTGQYNITDEFSSFVEGIHRGGSTCMSTLEVRVPCGVPILPQAALRLNSFKVVDLLGLAIQRIRR